MKNFPLLFPLLILLLGGCDPDENLPKATTPGGSGITSSTPSANNAIPLLPTGWQFLVGEVGSQGNPNNYQRTLTTGALATTPPLTNGVLGGVSSRTTSYTLGMAASLIKDTTSCYWLAGIPPSANLQVGASLTLKARVRLEDVQGEGVSLAIRGDKDTQAAVLSSTTQGRTPIRGTTDFTEYSVTLRYTTAVDRFAVYFVMLPNTTGTVIITDVAVQVN